MDKLQHCTGQAVFQESDIAVALDLKARPGDAFGRFLLVNEETHTLNTGAPGYSKLEQELCRLPNDLDVTAAQRCQPSGQCADAAGFALQKNFSAGRSGAHLDRAAVSSLALALR